VKACCETENFAILVKGNMTGRFQRMLLSTFEILRHGIHVCIAHVCDTPAGPWTLHNTHGFSVIINSCLDIPCLQVCRSEGNPFLVFVPADLSAEAIKNATVCSMLYKVWWSGLMSEDV
jgi:hypothetical protein